MTVIWQEASGEQLAAIERLLVEKCRNPEAIGIANKLDFLKEKDLLTDKQAATQIAKLVALDPFPESKARLERERKALLRLRELEERQAELAEKFRKKEEAEERNRQELAALAVPDGYYAIAGERQDTDFYQSRKAGVLKLYGSPGGWRREAVGFVDSVRVLRAVRAQGIEDSRMRFAEESGSCWMCTSPLSKEESRERGLGPWCYSKRQKEKANEHAL